MDPARRSERSALFAVPVLLLLIDGLSRLVPGEATEYLVVPPLAVVIYLLFADPERSDSRLRAVVILPLVAAVTGELGYRLIGPTPWGIAAVVLVVLLAQRALRARMPPALAIAVLAMFLRIRGPWYALDVGVATMLVWLAFVAWRRVEGRPGHA